MAYSAAIFDLDGTLLDSLADIAHAANEVLAARGLAEHPLDQYRFLVGDGVQVLFERAIGAERRTESLVAECVAAFGVTYERQWNQRSRPYDGIAELLTTLGARGARMAVLSNKPQTFTEKCVREYFSAWRIEPVLGQRPSVPRKPDPAGALEIAAGWGVTPAECLYLGDSLVDMQTARRAQMFAVGAAWGFRPRAELEAHGAQAVVEHPLELLRWFE